MIKTENYTPDYMELLRQAGLRVTRSRLALARLLFGKGNRHVTADILFSEIKAEKISISLATIYNTLNSFHQAGLLREVVVDGQNRYFDTNCSPHHHFYSETEKKLYDIEQDAVALSKIPSPPQGYEVAGVDVIVRLKK